MIVDAFLFFNELDLLELRLNELDPVVDRFILVECTTTHSGNDKPLFFDEAKREERFEKFRPKIDHRIIQLPEGGSWVKENYHRNAIGRAVIDLAPNDIVMISDMDEIPRASQVNYAAQVATENGLRPYTFWQSMHYYYFNCWNHNEWKGTVVTKAAHLNDHQPQWFRNHKDEFPRISNGGWHFAYLGGVERIKYKLESFAHREFDNDSYNNSKYIEARLEDGIDFYNPKNQLKFRRIDETYPEYLRENLDRYKDFIKEIPE